MPITALPSMRPLVRDANRQILRPDRAGLSQQLVDSLDFSWACDLKNGPYSYANWDASGAGSGNAQTVRNFAWSTSGTIPINTASGKGVYLGAIYVPSANNDLARNLVIYAYGYVTSTAASAKLHFLSSTQRLYSWTISNATLGSPGANVVGVTAAMNVPVGGEKFFSVYLEYIAGGTEKTYIQGLGAHWEPLDGLDAALTIETTWTYSLSQGYESSGYSDNAHVLKWLQRKLAQLAAHRPREVHQKWLGAWQSSRTVTGSSATGVLGRYKFYVGEHPPSLELRALCKVTGSGTFKIRAYLNGNLVETDVTASTAYTWTTITLTTGLTKAAVNEVYIDDNITVTSGTCVLKVA